MGNYFSMEREYSITFQLISDLHLEFFDNLTQAIETLHIHLADENHSKILIVCGDVCSLETANKTIFDEFFHYISSEFKQIIYVAGNHEYYGSNFRLTLNEIKARLLSYDNIKFLEKDSIKINNLTIVGTTLWSLPDKHCLKFFKSFSSDFKCIKNPSEGIVSSLDFIIEHKKCLEYLENVMNNLESEERVLIASHHVPGLCDVIDRHVRRKELVSLYGSDLREFLCRHKNKIVLWCCGHCHQQIRKKLHGVNIVSNPFGYFNLGPEKFNRNFNALEVFSV
eukprot:TRINITY_DN3052_c1_g2_i1.p2 TRINITY_DN3052_c1_g2~~TRINITY_DN3052_c1_g2_i1.p2  ORF type:complete len:281 (-),score=67.68 TRINITY_DN3052_c1_g2_i1:2439-3281(-)